eukprot:CAMPEP_0184700958 /NCGR_PEP_ID=MMETSP0313-20130426/17285_1 /TAXON_ID=2792 /ORGANISM="Porphyridium aerugineum, Strain SAG 1380-2" /LENGTH=366 /DNA_ID=CAMNT_0027160845 /DNA_START=250 /DNA_END=1350 /DNA_ORIENTATION=-
MAFKKSTAALAVTTLVIISLGMTLPTVAAQTRPPPVDWMQVCMYGNPTGDQARALEQCELERRNSITNLTLGTCIFYSDADTCALGDPSATLFQAARLRCFTQVQTNRSVTCGFRIDYWEYNVSSTKPPTECDSTVVKVTGSDVKLGKTGCMNYFQNQAVRFYCGNPCNDGPDCFAESSTVNVMENGSPVKKELRELAAGELVESFDASGNRVFEKMMNIEHMEEQKMQVIMDISYKNELVNGVLHVTPSHLVMKAPTSEMVRAVDLKVNDELFHFDAEGNKHQVAVSQISSHTERVLNPQVENMNIVVDGVLASCWSHIKLFGGLVRADKIPGITMPLRVLSRLGLFRLIHVIDEFVHRIVASLY